MTKRKVRLIDKVFLVLMAGALIVGVSSIAIQSFSGVDGTFGIDGDGTIFIEVNDVNITRDWFRGLVNVTNNVLGILEDLIPDAANTYDLGSSTMEWNDLYLGTGRAYFYTDQDEWIYSNDDYIIVGVDGTHSIELDSSAIRPVTPDSLSLGGVNNEWMDLFLGTGKIYLYTDQQEAIYSTGGTLIFEVGGADQFGFGTTAIDLFGNYIYSSIGAVKVNDNLMPNAADISALGGANSEWSSLYMGTGWIFFALDQGEGIRSTGSALTFKVDGVEQLALTGSVFRPFNARADAIDLGSISAEWNDLFMGTGRIHFYTDQGESIYSNGTHLKIDGTSGILPDGGNNTGAIGADSERWAGGWFTTMTAKSVVTGKVIEKEIAPAPWESFEEGDTVKIYDADYFVKTDKVLDYVVGVVTNNPEMEIVDYNVTWEMVAENVSHTETVWELQPYNFSLTEEVEYLRNITDAFNNSYEVILKQEDAIEEFYIEEKEYTLWNGSKIMIQFNKSRPLTEIRYENVSREKTVWETVYHNGSTENPIYGEKGDPVLCVAGRTRVKISEPVFKNDILVAESDGKARSLRSAIQLLKNQYSGKTLNWNSLLTVLEGMNLRTFGQVMEDSDGSYCWALLW